MVTYNFQYNPDDIQSWFCECKNGARSLGCCYHIASVILFCAFERFCEKHQTPGQHLLDIFPATIRDVEDSNELQTQTQTQTNQGQSTQGQTKQAQTPFKQVKRKGNWSKRTVEIR